MRTTLLLSVVFASSLVAQQADGPALAPIHGRIGVDLQSQYFFRGLLQENQGIIAQPWIELSTRVLDADQGVPSLQVVTGQWNSLHDAAQTGGSGGNWYESRFYLGVETQIGERLTAGVRYNSYATPNGSPAFNTTGRPVQEFAFYGSYNDRGQLFDDFALRPHVLLANEFSGQRDGGTDRGSYLEIGIEPVIEVGQIGDAPLTVSAPITAGFGIGDYYERSNTAGAPGGGGAEFLGFVQLGAVAHLPLGSSDGRPGPLHLDAGAHLILLGDNNADRNGNDSAELFFSIGVSAAF